MKRILYALFFILALVPVCSSCNQKEFEPKLDDRLVGTKWQTEDFVHQLIYGGTCYQVYEFVSTTEVECYSTRNGVVDGSDGTFKYALEYPHITIDVVDSKGVVTPTSYTFTDSRTMVRDGAESGSFYVKYYKQ